MDQQQQTNEVVETNIPIDSAQEDLAGEVEGRFAEEKDPQLFEMKEPEKNLNEDDLDSLPVIPAPPYVYELMNKLIQKDHKRLIKAKIVIAFREVRWFSKGEIVHESAKKTTPMAKMMNGYDFEIVLNKEEFEKASAHTKNGILDQALCRCDYKDNKAGDVNWCNKTPDLNIFIENASRYGLWSPAMRKAIQALKQANLFEESGTSESK